MKPITVFHLSADERNLVEVKRYNRLYAARRWARQHPGAEVFVRVRLQEADVTADLWLGFKGLYGVCNVTWYKLPLSDVERLPELLESV